MTGQIYDAVMTYSYTDDYKFDASENFMKGKKVDIPSLAKNSYESWSYRIMIEIERVDENTAILQLSDSNSSMKLLVDLNFDILPTTKVGGFMSD